MKKFARSGRIIAALVLGTSLTITASPAAFAKKKKTQTPDFTLSVAFRSAAREIQTALDAGDTATANARIESLGGLAQTPAEKYTAAALRMQLAGKLSDVQTQRKALTAMLQSGGAPSSDLPYLRYLAGYFSYVLNDMNDAIAQLTYARQLGYAGPQVTLLLADANIRLKKNSEGLALVSEAMKQQRAAGGNIRQPWYDRAAAISYAMKDWSGVAGWYRLKLADYPTPENWRSAISNYMANPALNAAMKLDLYRLLTANGALASERDYQAYAEAAVQNGQYGEAKAIIEAGRAGGKLLSNDAATASIYKTASARATKDKAALTALAAKAGGASEAADAYLAWGDYARAAELYRAALKQTPADPGQVNTRLGIALARAGNVEEARKALAAVTGPWSDVAQFWLMWVNQKPAAQPAKA